MKWYTRQFFPAVLLALGCAAPATAGTITVSAVGQGWMTATADNKDLPGNNYLAGNCGYGDCYFGEFRNFFRFSIPVLDGPVLSASLILDTRYAALLQAPSLVYQVTSLPEAFAFGDLGTGSLYGSRTYSASDQYRSESIALDAAALAAIAGASGGTFGVGGRVTSAVTFSGTAPDELIFGQSGGAQQLEIVTGNSGKMLALGSAASAAVPEPVPVALFGAGMVAVGLLRLRRGLSAR